MLDFADVVAINKFERRGAEDALRDVGRQLVRNREAFGKQPEDMPVFGTSAATFNDDGVTALYQHLRGLLAEHGLALDEGPSPRVERAALLRIRQVRAGRPGPLPRRDRRDGARLPRRDRASWSSRPARCQRSRRWPTPSSSLSTTSAADVVARLAQEARDDLDDETSEAARGVALRRPGVRRAPRPRVAVRQPDPARRAADVRRPRRAGAVLAPREPPGPLPVHRRRLPVQARERGPGADVRRRGRPGAHQPPVQAAVRGPAGDPAVDGVRLGDPLRPRPRRAARHLRQGRHVRRQRRDARRHEGALRRLRPARPTTSVCDDDQRPGADGARVLPQHRDRPGPRAAASTRRRRCARSAARCRPTSSRRTRARTPACSRPSSRCAAWPTSRSGSSSTACATSTRSRSPATTSPRPGRTPSASSRSPSPTASPTSSPTSRAAWTSTTSRPTCRSSSATAWTRSTP